MKSRINRKGIIIFGAVILLMLIIFVFSAQNGGESNGISMTVTRFFAGILFFDYDQMSAEQQAFICEHLNHFVRKGAHFSVYLLMGAFSYLAVRLSGLRLRFRFVPALCLCAVYAAADEIHQYFTPGRSPKLTDVLIDISGAVCGILIIKLIFIVVSHAKDAIKNKNGHAE